MLVDEDVAASSDEAAESVESRDVPAALERPAESLRAVLSEATSPLAELPETLASSTEDDESVASRVDETPGTVLDESVDAPESLDEAAVALLAETEATSATADPSLDAWVLACDEDTEAGEVTEDVSLDVSDEADALDTLAALEAELSPDDVIVDA